MTRIEWTPPWIGMPECPKCGTEANEPCQRPGGWYDSPWGGYLIHAARHRWASMSESERAEDKRKRREYERMGIDHACPTCQAAPGRACRDHDDGDRSSTHSRRKALTLPELRDPEPEPDHLEAAQASGPSRWHAVKPGADVTLCGRSIARWPRKTGHRWDEHPSERCAMCSSTSEWMMRRK